MNSLEVEEESLVVESGENLYVEENSNTTETDLNQLSQKA